MARLRSQSYSKLTKYLIIYDYTTELPNFASLFYRVAYVEIWQQRSEASFIFFSSALENIQSK